MPSSTRTAQAARSSPGPTTATSRGFRIYGVVGRTGEHHPELSLRVGVYGHFATLDWAQVFAGAAPGIWPVRTRESETGR